MFLAPPDDDRTQLSVIGIFDEAIFWAMDWAWAEKTDRAQSMNMNDMRIIITGGTFCMGKV